MIGEAGRETWIETRTTTEGERMTEKSGKRSIGLLLTRAIVAGACTRLFWCVCVVALWRPQPGERTREKDANPH